MSLYNHLAVWLLPMMMIGRIMAMSLVGEQEILWGWIELAAKQAEWEISNVEKKQLEYLRVHIDSLSLFHWLDAVKGIKNYSYLIIIVQPWHYNVEAFQIPQYKKDFTGFEQTYNSFVAKTGSSRCTFTIVQPR